MRWPPSMDSLIAGSYTRNMMEGTQRGLAAIVSADAAGYSRLIGNDEFGPENEAGERHFTTAEKGVQQNVGSVVIQERNV